jgi:hypothetical protein
MHKSQLFEKDNNKKSKHILGVCLVFCYAESFAFNFDLILDRQLSMLFEEICNLEAISL